MKKGFTLIELLAVIVILGIIAVITVPKINKQLDKTHEQITENQALSYAKAIEQFQVEQKLENSNVKLDGMCTINEKGNIVNNLEEYKLNINGEKPKAGILAYYDSKIIYGCLEINKYRVIIKDDNIENIKKGNCPSVISEEYITYEETENNTIEINEISEEYGDKIIIIPETIDGKTVTKINSIELSNVDTIIIPNTITELSRFAFQNTNAKTIILSNKINTIQTNQFVGTQIEEIYLPDSITTISPYSFPSTLKKVTFGKNLRTISNYAFSGTSIEELVVPDSVETIGQGAFKETTNLRKATIGAKTINYEAFNNSGLHELILTNTVEQIGSYAFNNNTSLEKVTFGENIQSIERFAFQNASMEEIYLPDSLKEIEYGTFGDIAELKTIRIGKNLESSYHSFILSNNQLEDNLETVYNHSNINLENDANFDGRSNYTIINR